MRYPSLETVIIALFSIFIFVTFIILIFLFITKELIGDSQQTGNREWKFSRFGLILGGLNFVLSILAVILAYAGDFGGWLLEYVIIWNFPSAFLFSLVPDTGRIPDTMVGYMRYLAILGSVWWYFVGWFIEACIRKFLKGK